MNLKEGGMVRNQKILSYFEVYFIFQTPKEILCKIGGRLS